MRADHGAGAMGLDFTRDGCGGAANSWGGLTLDLNLRHSADIHRFPGPCLPPLVYVQCVPVGIRTAVQLLYFV